MIERGVFVDTILQVSAINSKFRQVKTKELHMPSMIDYFNTRKQDITSFLDNYVGRKAPPVPEYNIIASDIYQRLTDFTSNGKMIRGGLVYLGYELFSEDANAELVKTAAALELFQSALLVHDDIMDRDHKRRGNSSVFYKYSRELAGDNIEDHYHTGEALGICAGDISFFAAYHILSSLIGEHPAAGKILEKISAEMIIVGSAQMSDVYWGVSPTPPDTEAVENLYRHKTGRYTFSLPLACGALMAGRSTAEVNTLETLGENLGIIFQIKDDEIGLYGDPAKTGKNRGSDICEGKQTLHMRHLFEVMSETEKNSLTGLFGKKSISESELDGVYDLISKYDIQATLDMKVEQLGERVDDCLSRLRHTNGAGRKILNELIAYNRERTR